jgi:hypothetical protein
MAIPILIRTRHKGYQSLLTERGNFTRRGREIFRGAHLRQALAWWSLFLPRHFERSAAGRYGYQKRTKSYLAQKAQSYHGHMKSRHKRGGLPGKRERATSLLHLIWSGRLKQATEDQPLVRPYPTRATLTMTLPGYASIRPRMLSHPNLARELTRIIRPERLELAKILNREVHKGIQAIAGETVTTTQ